LLSALSVLPGTDEHAAAASPGLEDRSWEAKITEIIRLASSASRQQQRSGAQLWGGKALLCPHGFEAVPCKRCHIKASQLAYSNVHRWFHLQKPQLLPSALPRELCARRPTK